MRANSNLKLFIKTLLIIYLIFSLCIIYGYAQFRHSDRTPFPYNLDKEIVGEINLARQNPKKYASFLEQLKPYYVGKFIKRPGEPTVMTEEGVSAVDEAIRFLKSVKPVATLKYSEGMSKAAMDHIRDQGQKGMLGHRGSDSSQPADRVNRYGTWQWIVGENISYGRDQARDIVIGLIIDDGIPSRGHRENIFNQSYHFVGVAYGDHKTFGAMSVITFAGGYVEKRGK